MTSIRIVMMTAVCAATLAVAQPGNAQTGDDRSEFSRLVHQRNDLYTQLTGLEAQTPNADTDSQREWVQDQLDLVEQRLATVAARAGLEVPRRPAAGTVTGSDAASAVAMSGPAGVQPFTPKQKAEFNKLVYQRNKLNAQLTGLDEQASKLIKAGRNPLVIHAEQVSVQDQLDLTELRLAILATRHGVAVPPVPGRDPAPEGASRYGDDEAGRDIQRAFARGRERANRQMQDDALQFMTSLDFWAFLND